MSLSRWPGWVWEWHNCVGISQSLTLATGWSIDRNRCLIQSLTGRKSRKHRPGLLHAALNVQNCHILQQTECCLQHEQKREDKGGSVAGLFHGNEPDLEDPSYSIPWEVSSAMMEGCFIHHSQEPRRNRSQNHPTKLPSQVQVGFSHAWDSR